ncbi:hypothetical protein H8K47_02230 [Undibacterium sp. CY7W]|uniref:Uncharacterized protein n=1 Tax=Undibacterium rugosum TaxID=2762291 RepID=A0A923I5Y8_9BURK|nr:hypothetical protein [Undibacterium rugosum]MBC3934168.1 hypothetical protein [Undibacterium rugosum]
MSLPHAQRQHQRRLWLLWCLLPALLLAQWTGLSHRLAHANWIGGKPQLQLISQAYSVWNITDSQSDDSVMHSCALTDASTSAAYLTFLPPDVPLLNLQPTSIRYAVELEWLAQLLLAFASRAPPVTRNTFL